MTIREITSYLEAIAPTSVQESYDNSGLLVGDPKTIVSKALVALDVTEGVVQEAIDKNCELIIAHHPIVFGGLKRFTGKNYVERTVMMAIKNDIAIYAIHTNLDNVYEGVNYKIGDVLGIDNPKILAPKKGLLNKLVVFVPKSHKQEVLSALFEAGAGHIGNYDECSFQTSGTGSFRANDDARPFVGEKNTRHHEEEYRVEVLVPKHKLSKVVGAMLNAHPYEEVAYDIYTVENEHKLVGSGMYGSLSTAIDTLDFLKMVKDKFGGAVRHTAILKDKVQKIAWCGGSGSFLLNHAKAVGADVFVTSDFKYHQFFDAENEIVVADIGHFENEQFTKDLIASMLKEKFTTFAVLLTETNTNPINYL